MKILIITPYLPYEGVSHAGGRLIIDAINHLRERHEVRVISFVTEEELPHIAKLKYRIADVQAIKFDRVANTGEIRGAAKLRMTLHRGVKVLMSILTGKPYLVSKYSSSKMRRLIRRQTSEIDFDVVEVNYSYMGQYLKDIRSGKKVLFEHDVSMKPYKRFYEDSKGLLGRMLARREYRSWVRYETSAALDADMVMTLGEEDSELLRSFLPDHYVKTIVPAVEVREVEEMPKYPESLSFMGALDRTRTNVDAVRYFLGEIFPMIKRDVEATVFYVVGPDAPQELLAEAREDVIFTGYIEDVERFLATQEVFVAPIRHGGGVKIKVLHAMSVGLPVVTTTVGAEGIHAERGREIFIEDNPRVFAERVVALLKDENLREEVGGAGKEFVRRNHSLEVRLESIEKTYADLASAANGNTVSS